MNVLHYLALQFEALITLLQGAHCTNAEKLVLPGFQLAGSLLSRKHGLATFINKQLIKIVVGVLERYEKGVQREVIQKKGKKEV